MTRLLILFPILLAITACASPKSKRMPVTPQPMVCAGNVPASVTLYSPEEAKLVYGGKAYTLERETTASGVKYAARGVTYWNKGINAALTIDGKTTNCTYIPKPGL